MLQYLQRVHFTRLTQWFADSVCTCCFMGFFAFFLQLLGCRGPLADREPGHMFATPARICQVPNHAE